MRAIDASKLVRKLCDISSNNDEFGRGVAVGISTVITEISKQPTLTLDDLRPKGRWVEGYPVTCSICGHSAETLYEDCNIYRAIRTPYCSYCGADMRGGGEDG